MMPISSQQRLAIARCEKEGPPKLPETTVVEVDFEVARWMRESAAYYAEKKRKEDEWAEELNQRNRAQMMRQLWVPEDVIVELLKQPEETSMMTPAQQRKWDANVASNKLMQPPVDEDGELTGFISAHDGKFHSLPKRDANEPPRVEPPLYEHPEE